MLSVSNKQGVVYSDISHYDDKTNIFKAIYLALNFLLQNITPWVSVTYQDINCFGNSKNCHELIHCPLSNSSLNQNIRDLEYVKDSKYRTFVFPCVLLL